MSFGFSNTTVASRTRTCVRLSDQPKARIAVVGDDLRTPVSRTVIRDQELVISKGLLCDGIQIAADPLSLL